MQYFKENDPISEDVEKTVARARQTITDMTQIMTIAEVSLSERMTFFAEKNFDPAAFKKAVRERSPPEIFEQSIADAKQSIEAELKNREAFERDAVHQARWRKMLPNTFV